VKNVIKEMFIITLVLTVFLGIFGILGHIENTYTKECEIVNVQGDVITVVDKDGDEWTFYGTDYEIGEIVKVRMHTNHTTKLSDDKLEKVW
jgi:hypothetical protein